MKFFYFLLFLTTWGFFLFNPLKWFRHWSPKRRYYVINGVGFIITIGCLYFVTPWTLYSFDDFFYLLLFSLPLPLFVMVVDFFLKEFPRTKTSFLHYLLFFIFLVCFLSLVLAIILIGLMPGS